MIAWLKAKDKAVQAACDGFTASGVQFNAPRPDVYGKPCPGPKYPTILDVAIHQKASPECLDMIRVAMKNNGREKEFFQKMHPGWVWGEGIANQDRRTL